MVAALGNNAAIDFYIYNNDFALFRKLLTNKTEDYTHFVIIPHFIEGGESTRSDQHPSKTQTDTA